MSNAPLRYATLSTQDSVNKNLREQDLLITELCIRNPESGRKTFYEHFYAYIYNVTYRYLNNSEEAEETTNDCFIQIFGNLAKYEKGKFGIRPWLKRIAINKSIDKQRKLLRIRNHKEEEVVFLPIVNYESGMDKLAEKDIHLMLDKLPKVQKLVFILYEIEGFSHKEIGEILKIKDSVSRVFLSRAKVELRNLFVKYYYER